MSWVIVMVVEEADLGLVFSVVTHHILVWYPHWFLWDQVIQPVIDDEGK